MTKETIDALTGFLPWIVPECILGLFACILFVGGTFRRDRNYWGAAALVALASALVAHWIIGRPGVAEVENTLYASPVWPDYLSYLIKAVAIVGGAVLVLFTWEDVSDDNAAEFHGCLLVIIAGACFTASANDLVTLFLALEMISIPTYIALYLPKSDEAAQESAVKYFLLSIFSSALLLFGFSYLYGLAGTTNLHGIMEALSAKSSTGEAAPALTLVALLMVVAGLGFKITAVPFHFYAPDVYQGTFTGGAALLAFIPKLAGFVALIRVLGLVPVVVTGSNGQSLIGPVEAGQASMLLWILAAITMTLGNVLALMQDNVKRMLAYSSVAHSGYMLIGLAVAPYLASDPNSRATGVEAILFYLVAYGAMTVGAFAVIEYLSTRDRPVETVDDFAGLSKSHPGVALVMALFLFSLIGLPPTPGFWGKWNLLFTAFSIPDTLQGEDVKQAAYFFRVLALIAVINAAVASWYYLRIVTVMYLRTPLQPLEQPRPAPRTTAIWICALVTLVFCYPTPLVQRAREAAHSQVTISATP